MANRMSRMRMNEVTSLGEKMTSQEFEEVCRAAGLPSSGSLVYKEALAGET